MSGSLSPAVDAELGVAPVVGGAGEFVMCSERKAIVSFLSYEHPGRVAVVCDHMIAIKSGYPNEEPRPHIPRFKNNGDNSYLPIAKVLNRNWSDKIAEDNAHRFPNYDFYKNSDFQHYVFNFKESTTEVLGMDWRIETNLTYESLFELAQKEFG